MSTPRRPQPYRPAPEPAAPAATPVREARAPRRGRPPAATAPAGAARLRPSSWLGAIVLMSAFGAVLWIVQIVNDADGYALNRFGLRPRTTAGLWGVLTAPFLHVSWAHLLSNTFPVVLIGWVVLVSGGRVWLIVTTVSTVLGGLLTWLIAPSNTVIVGASGLVFGWLGFLIARAFITRKIKWIVVAAVVLIFFGTLLSGLIPLPHSEVSWQAHIGGFLAGIAAGALLHTRRGERVFVRGSAVS